MTDGVPAGDIFAVKDCALSAIATGTRAHNLPEFASCLQSVHPGSIYYHFWGGLLRPGFDDMEANNDFANWVRSADGLHDETLAERLNVVDPTDFVTLEDLRSELVELVEERMYESERLRLTNADMPFSFIRSKIVVFNTRKLIEEPRQLATMLPGMSVGSVFYHFIDARRRTETGEDDFRAWLRGCGEEYSELCDKLAEVDPYFVSLVELRAQLAALFAEHFGEAA